MRMRSKLVVGFGAASALSVGVFGGIAAQTPGDAPEVPGERPQHARQHPNRGQQLNPFADILGVEPGEIAATLQDGGTLAEVAEEAGVSPDVLISAMLAELSSRLDQVVADGNLTQDEANAKIAQATERATTFVYEGRQHDGPRLGGQGHDGQRPGGRNQGQQLSLVAELLGVEPGDVASMLAQGGTLAEVATEAGINPDVIVNAIVATAAERVEQGVENGNLTDEQADEILSQATDRAARFVYEAHPGVGEGRGEGERPHRQGRRGPGKLIGQAAQVIGVEPQDVFEALRGGTSIAEYAASQGVSEDALVAGITAEVEAKLAEAVAGGRLTQEEADAKLTEMVERLAEAIHNVPETPTPAAAGAVGDF
jgi:lambda repressor-like predicted transcriptional regulator